MNCAMKYLNLSGQAYKLLLPPPDVFLDFNCFKWEIIIKLYQEVSKSFNIK